MLGRIDIEANDVGGLFFEGGIVGSHVPLHSVRLEPCPSPSPSDQHVVDSKLLGQTPCAPVRRSIAGLLLRPGENPSLDRYRQSPRLGTPVPRVESRQAIRLKPLLPPTHVAGIASQGVTYRHVGLARRQHQDQPRSPHVFRPQLARPRPSLQLPALRRRQFNSSFHDPYNES